MLHVRRWARPCGVMLGLAFGGVAAGETYNVPGDFGTIQACIDAAQSGDECVVAPGTYNELINFLGKAITLRSSGGAEVTIIDAGLVADPGTRKPVVRCDTGEGPGTILDGFTLTGGTGGTGSPCFPGYSCGGGMFNNGSSPTVINCTFSGNRAGPGGGMYNNNASPSVTDCTFIGNTAVDAAGGGGMFNWDSSSPEVTNCAFSGNTAFEGAGMCSHQSNPTVVNCTFSGNTSPFGGYSGTGAGMYNSSGNATVTDCTFTGNRSGYAAGMYNLWANPTVTNCTFSGNTAGSCGGMANDDASPTILNCTFSGNTTTEESSDGGGMCNNYSHPVVTNCVFDGNRATEANSTGGGMYNEHSNPTLRNCTFSGNAATFLGGAMHNRFGSGLVLTNCMFTGNTARDGGGMYSYASPPSVTNCTFIGNTATNRGGGMYNSASSILINSTFTGNTAIDTGGGMFNGGTQTITNCIVWGNSPNNIRWSFFDETTISYSDVGVGGPSGPDGEGNINADPMFVRDPDGGDDGFGDDPGTPDVDEGANDDYGDLRLLAGSPCIDSGDPALVLEPGLTDLDGHARVLCAQVDIGAFEFGIGDFDCDTQIGLADYGSWAACVTGPDGGPYDDGCEAFDFEFDGDVDLFDWRGFQVAFTGWNP